MLANVPQIKKRLAVAIPNPRCELQFQTPWQLLVATILSAQSTDKRVNSVTPELFRRYPSPAKLGAADQADVEEIVKSTGFYRNKAKSIREASQMIAAEFGGEVPRTLDALMKLPGVARKTANLVLGTAYGLNTGMIVDTHAGRVARRLNLTEETDPKKVERDLCEQFARDLWTDTSHRLVLHGRYVCLARKPKCDRCALNEVCASRESEPAGTWSQRAAWERVVVESWGRDDPTD